MKIGLFTDIHIGLEGNSEFFHIENIKLANWIKNEFSKQKVKDIFILGDVFHNRKQINLESLKNAYDFFAILQDFNIHILTGNHDCFYLDNSDVHSLSLLKGWKNISVYDSPTVLSNFGISMIPWGTLLEDIPEADYVFGHFEIAGFEMQGTLCEKGLKGAELVKKAKRSVFSGHFHKPQIRNYGDKEVHYLGSPYQHNFGERDEDKYIYTLDLDTHDLESFTNTISPKHFYVKQDETNFGKFENQIIRPIITNPETQEEFMTKLKSVAPSYIKDAEFIMEGDVKLNETIEDFQMSVFSEDVKTFVGMMEVDSEEMRQKIIQQTIELHDEVMS